MLFWTSVISNCLLNSHTLAICPLRARSVFPHWFSQTGRTYRWTREALSAVGFISKHWKLWRGPPPGSRAARTRAGPALGGQEAAPRPAPEFLFLLKWPLGGGGRCWRVPRHARGRASSRPPGAPEAGSSRCPRPLPDRPPSRLLGTRRVRPGEALRPGRAGGVEGREAAPGLLPGCSSPAGRRAALCPRGARSARASPSPRPPPSSSPVPAAAGAAGGKGRRGLSRSGGSGEEPRCPARYRVRVPHGLRRLGGGEAASPPAGGHAAAPSPRPVWWRGRWLQRSFIIRNKQRTFIWWRWIMEDQREEEERHIFWQTEMIISGS